MTKSAKRNKTAEILLRGLKQQCPGCGKASVFESRFRFRFNCPVCGFKIRSREPDTLFFVYLSTVSITGLYFFLIFSVPFSHPVLVRTLLGAIAIPAFFLTLPMRKSLALALDALGES